MSINDRPQQIQFSVIRTLISLYFLSRKNLRAAADPSLLRSGPSPGTGRGRVKVVEVLRTLFELRGRKRRIRHSTQVGSTSARRDFNNTQRNFGTPKKRKKEKNRCCRPLFNCERFLTVNGGPSPTPFLWGTHGSGVRVSTRVYGLGQAGVVEVPPAGGPKSPPVTPLVRPILLHAPTQNRCPK